MPSLARPGPGPRRAELRRPRRVGQRLVLPVAVWLSACSGGAGRDDAGSDAPVLRDAAREASTADAAAADGAGGDAGGPDAGGPDAGAPAPGCRAPRACAGPAAAPGATFTVTLDTGASDANVHLHAGLDTAAGPIVPWSARLCCGADPLPLSAGVARLDGSGASARLVGPEPTWPLEAAPALVLAGASPWLVDPLARFERALPLDPAALVASEPVALELGARLVETPALAPLADGDVLALVATRTGAELRRLAPDGTLRGSTELARTIGRPGLTPTCDGLLATWEEDGLALALPLSPEGEATGDPVVYGEAALEALDGHRPVVFDGEHVVTVGPRHVYELGPDGAVAVTTISLVAPLAAFGTDDGLVVLQRESVSGEGAPVVLLERETGAFVRELLRIDTGTLYASDAVVLLARGAGAGPPALVFGAASYTRRDRIVGARVECR